MNTYTFTYAFESRNAEDIVNFLANNVDTVSNNDLIILCDMESDTNNAYNYIIKVKDSNNSISNWFWPSIKRTEDSNLDPINHKNEVIKNIFNRNILNTNQINSNLKTLYNEHFDLVIPVQEKSLKNIISEHSEQTNKTLSQILNNVQTNSINIDKSKLNNAYGKYKTSYIG